MTINWWAVLNHFADGVVFGSGFILSVSVSILWIEFIGKRKQK